MRTDNVPTISRHDYRPYPYALHEVQLWFDLEAERTRVQSRLTFEGTAGAPLVLNGEDLELESVSVEGRLLTPEQFRLEANQLTLYPTESQFTVEISGHCRPAANSTLMGLYVSGESLFTQCEAEGFRRITWFPDRPDVMSRYKVTLRADKARYPVLLSNGNLVSQRELEGNRHEAVWHDPHPKPSYLFALVAGQFAVRETNIPAGDGRDALLQVYSDPDTHDKTAWALDCLRRSIKWDEERFGLGLDLDRFMIVAARDFNMGAMENKGLNIFNSSYVLADPQTATDASYLAIESVIGHEYFHNWTGNRVTCRDWFQLSLKEGLTVFRDQEFSADMMARDLPPAEAASARAIKRIDDVTALRVSQFPEDAGPMAHPIRPESYQEIANFYTATVYEKGAEVIRMQHTLLGEAVFQEGIAEYFRRHDGQAVTCDDFVDAMDAVYRRHHPGKTLDIFRRWYEQAGTPRVRVEMHYDATSRSCIITLTQSNPPAGIEKRLKAVENKPPLLIPFALGMLDDQGQPLTLQLEGQSVETALLELSEAQQSWTFSNIPSRPVLSLLRNFSAPVIVDYEYSNAELALLASHDPDPFSRWEAGQALGMRQLLCLISEIQAGVEPTIDPQFIQVMTALLSDETLTDGYKSRALSLPPAKLVLERTDPMTPVVVAQARQILRGALGQALQNRWQQIFEEASRDEPADYTPDAPSCGRRALKNLALSYLAAGRHPSAETLALNQYYQANNMTDRMGALNALLDHGVSPKAAEALDHFYQSWQHDPLVIDRWFALQATASSTNVDTVRSLMLHPAFTLRNPNRARALVFQFCLNNMQGAHQAQAYDFWAEQVIALDALNPEIAARLSRAFDNWSRYAQPHRDQAKAAYERLQQHTNLSRNVSEIVNKTLEI